MNNNLEFFNLLKDVPQDAKKPITAGRMRGFTAINPVWRIKAMTEVFGPYGQNWYEECTVFDKYTSEQTGETLYIIEVKLYVKYPGAKDFCPPAIGYGSAKLMAMEKAGLRMDDEAVKKAKTDAFGNAAKVFGVGASVYYEHDDTSKYYTEEEAPQEAKVHVKPIPPVLEPEQIITPVQEAHLDAKLKENQKTVEGVLGYINKEFRTDSAPATDLSDLTYREYCKTVGVLFENVIV